MLRLVHVSAHAILAWIYLGYPALVAGLARLRPLRLDPRTPRPGVSIAIAVHDEEPQIRARIADALAQAGPGLDLREVLVGSDGSTDGTDEVVRTIAAGDARVRLLALPRGGTTPTQNALIEAATGEVVVLTDAETRFEPGAIAALADAFRDPRVGCATGRLEWQREDATATSRNEGAYWRYERRVRALESRAGFLTAGTGAILAIRRSTYRPIRATVGLDHLVPLQVHEDGGLVVYVPEAVGTDRPISGLREQFRNRTRTATRGIAANLSMVPRLTPWRHPKAALALWSHKLLRWATPWFVGAAGLSGAALAASGRRRYALTPLAILGGAVASVAAHLMTRRGMRPPAPFTFCRAFAVVNLAFAKAWVDVIRGRTITTWHRTEADRPIRR